MFKFENYQGARSVLKNVSPKKSIADENDTEESNSFLKDFDALEKELETVKKTGLASVNRTGLPTVSNAGLASVNRTGVATMNNTRLATSNNTVQATINNMAQTRLNTNGMVTYDLKTVDIDRKKKELEERLKSEQIKKDKKQQELDDIKRLDATLKNEEEQRKRLEEEYRRQLFTVEATRQASKTDLKNAEARLLELKTKQAKIANIFAELKKAEKVDICFLLDATGSMDPYISITFILSYFFKPKYNKYAMFYEDEAKNVIHRIIDKLKSRFNDFELRASFVGYRDHSEGLKRITVQGFSENIDSFKTFVSKVEAMGGSDQCEDVFGGLEVKKTNILFI